MGNDNILAGLEGFFSGFEKGYVPFMEAKYKSNLEAQLKHKENAMTVDVPENLKSVYGQDKINKAFAGPGVNYFKSQNSLEQGALSPEAQDYWANYVAETGGLPEGLGMGSAGLKKTLLEHGAKKGKEKGFNPATKKIEYKARTGAKVGADTAGAKVQNTKVDAANTLADMMDKNYNPKTKEYTIPPSFHTELALGVARLLSPSGVVSEKITEKLQQRTGQESLNELLIWAGADPKDVGGTTQSVSRFLAHTVARQGQLAEQARSGYGQGIGNKFMGVKSIKDFDTPGGSGQPGLFNAPQSGWTADKEQRYQELMKKKQAGNIQ